MYKQFWIYIITNLITNKIYIGQTKNLYDRLKAHKSAKNTDRIIVKSIRKYGWENHKVEILFVGENISIDEGDKMEIFYIKKHNSFCKDNKLGMNLTRGGRGGYITKEQYQKRDRTSYANWLKKIGKQDSKLVVFNKEGQITHELAGATFIESLSPLNIKSVSTINEIKRSISKNKWTCSGKKYIIGFLDDNPYELYLEGVKNRSNRTKGRTISKGALEAFMFRHKQKYIPILDLNTGVFFETMSEFCKHEERSFATIRERFKNNKYSGKYLMCKN